MNLFENLVKRTFEMHRAGAQAMPMFGPNKAIASVINKLSEIGIPDNLNNLALRMFRILRRVARLQVTISPPELPAILYPEPAYQEAALEEAYPSIEEPPEFVVTSRFDPLTGIIRRMVRSFLRRPRRPEPEEEPPEPPPSRRERVYTIPEYLQRIVAAIPPLVIIPPRPRPRPEIEKPRLGAEKRLETIVAPKGVEVLEKIYELVEEYEAPGMGVPLVPKVEPLKAVPPSLRMPPRMRRVRRGFQDLAKWVAGVSAAEPVITEIGLVDTYVEMQTSVYDVVSKQAEFRRFRPTYDWRPLILEATRIASERVFAWGRGEEEAGRPEAYAGPQIEGVAEALKGLVEGEFPPYVAEVLTREAESKTALVSSEVERISRQLAEEAAETYRQALAELLPVHSRAAVKELVHAPGLKELVTKKLRTSLEIMGIKEALLEEITERGLELGTKHPLQDYIEKIARLAGITRPGVPTYPVEEEDKVPTISPFHPIQEYVTRVARFAGLTKVELPIPGEEEIRLPIPTPIQPLQEYIDIAHKLAEASKLEEPIISIEEEVEEIARAPRHPIKAYLDLASRLGEFMGTRAAAVYGITAAHVPEVEYLGGELEVYKTFDFLSVVKEIVTSKVKAEKALTTALSGVVSSLLEVPVGEQALERVGLEVPVTVPSPRLLDMVPVLSRVEAIPRAQRSPTVRRERALERRRPIEIKVEPKIGDIDLRELERKIARILREEARRYGVY